MINKIIRGDCFDLFPKLPDESIDTIITDPPYNIADSGKLTKVGDTVVSTMTAWGEGFHDTFTDEDYFIFMSKLADQCFRVLKDGGNLLMFFDRSKPAQLARFYQLLTFQNMIIFVKMNPIPHIRKTNYRSGFEQCVWFTKGKPETFHFLRQDQMVNVFYGNIGQKITEHGTEKYRWMIDPLVLRHTSPNEIILDPFMGSGTTAEACLVLNRQFIGFELSPDYYQMSIDRLAQYRGMPRLTNWF